MHKGCQVGDGNENGSEILRKGMRYQKRVRDIKKGFEISNISDIKAAMFHHLRIVKGKFPGLETLSVVVNR